LNFVNYRLHIVFFALKSLEMEPIELTLFDDFDTDGELRELSFKFLHVLRPEKELKGPN
jgi:hypothetical protein